MSIERYDLRGFGSAVMPDDDSITQIGGAIDRTKLVEFIDVSAPVQAVSSSVSDTTQQVTMTYRDAAGSKLTNAATLSGQTPVAFGATPERILKAIKSATTTGDVAVEASTAERAGTAQAGAAAKITLDAGASAVNDAYIGMVIRLTSGTGVGQIRRVISYDGTTKIAEVDRPWGTVPDNTTGFRIAKGCYFPKAATEAMEVRRPFFDAGANTSGGAQKEYHEKIFLGNDNATLALTAAQVVEYSDPSGLVTFGLAATVGDNGTNGVGNNRLVAPSGITFDNSDKNIAGGQLAAATAIGTWLKLTLAGGTAAQKTQHLPMLKGNTT